MKHSTKQRLLDILFSVRKNKDGAVIAFSLAFFFGYSILSFQIRLKIFLINPNSFEIVFFLIISQEDVKMLEC